MRKVMKITGTVLFYLFLGFMVILVVLYASSTSSDKSIFGYRFYEVLSGSMAPTIKTGELVIIKMTEPEEIIVGDIVTKSLEQDGSVTLTHRVIDLYDDQETGQTMVQTKGDNSPSPDEPIPVDAVIGRVVTHIPYVGYAVSFVKSNPIALVFVLLAIVIIVLSLRYLFRKDTDTVEAELEILEAQAAAYEARAEELRAQAEDMRVRKPASQTNKQSGSTAKADRPKGDNKVMGVDVKVSG